MNELIHIASDEEIPSIVRALDSELRWRMVKLLGSSRLNVNQIAEALRIPQSTCVANIRLLEEAGLLKVEQVPASRGSQKLCSLAVDELVLPLRAAADPEEGPVFETEMPIGLYTEYRATPPCGLVGESSVIGYYDQVESFLNPRRAQAGLVWLTKGYLKYMFPCRKPKGQEVYSYLSVTMEVCSEFPGSNDNWPSDLTVWINDLEVGTWTSPGDLGGKRGRFTPAWWSTSDSQYGLLKSWSVTPAGSFIDGEQSGTGRLADLGLDDCEHITVRIGVKEEAVNSGGLNLFGRGFGNYDQGIILRMGVTQNL